MPETRRSGPWPRFGAATIAAMGRSYGDRVAQALVKHPISALLATALAVAPALAIAHGTETHDETPAPPPEVALAPGWEVLEYAAPAPGSYTLPRLGKAADGVLLDTRGETVALAERLAGRLSLVAFIYTRCGDVNGCPLATAVMRRVATRVAKDPAFAKRVQLLSVSFDPEWDTPVRLAEHAASFVPKGVDWQFLTANSNAELAPVLSGYGQAVTVDPGAKEVFSHILRVFLVDAGGEIRNIYSTSFLHADTTVADLRTLLLEEGEDTAKKNDSVPTYAAAADAPAARLLGLPGSAAPATGPQEARRIALGRKLFFDRRLSHNGTLSCAMCHVPAQGFANNELRTAVGIEGASVRRNAPTLLNVGLLETLFHDGREYSLAQQAWQPLLAADEMANVSIGAVVERLRAADDYAGRFEAAFDGRGPDMLNVGAALESYQRTLLAGGSAFDRWYFAAEQGGSGDGMSAQARTGFSLFTGKAGCAGCHRIGPDSALFTDQQFHNTGIGFASAMHKPAAVRQVQLAPGVVVAVDAAVIDEHLPPQRGDLGRYEVTTDPADRWKYRTAPLRNVALTAPYMHDGSLATLEDVVSYYNVGGTPRVEATVNKGQDARIRPLGLSSFEQRALVAFMHSLTGAGLELLTASAAASQ